MNERILVPTDGSELADRILDQVRRLAVPGESEVRLVRVVPSFATKETTENQVLVREAHEHLERLEETIESWGVEAKSTVTVGDPASEILALARAFDPSLLAMSTHGRTGIERWTRGSVAERVIRECAYPVLLANPFASRRAWRRILVPLDGSSRSASVLPLVAELAKTSGAEIVLFHATLNRSIDTTAEDAVLTRREARKLLGDLAATIEGVRVRVSMAAGHPAEAILRASRREGADLVAMSSHGRSGVSRWLMGSVAEQVLRRSKCPVLIHRASVAARRAERVAAKASRSS